MILVLNPGSSSLKYHLYNENLELIKSAGLKVLPKTELYNHFLACQEIFKEVEEYIDKIEYVGVRIVHGGPDFSHAMIVDKKVFNELNRIRDLAPLHNPQAISVIEAIQKMMKNVKIVTAFDTAFYHDLPAVNRCYPIPQDIAEKYQIRRYGFHGISHKYVCEQVDPKNESRVISIHLGAGCSVTAINKGQVIDTSMGLTPNGGLMMQVRPGDIDPSLVLFLVSKLGFKTAKEVIEKQSGLAAVTETNGEMLEVLDLAGLEVTAPGFKGSYEKTPERKEKAELAVSMFVDRIRKFIAAYTTEMNGVDIIAFTGNIGAGSELIRDMIMHGLGYLNYTNIEVVKPNEELAIALEIKETFMS